MKHRPSLWEKDKGMRRDEWRTEFPIVIKDAVKMLSRINTAQECVATGFHSSNTAGFTMKKIVISLGLTGKLLKASPTLTITSSPFTIYAPMCLSFSYRK